MKKKIKNFFKYIYRNVLKIMPLKVVINIENLRGYHRFLNLNKPQYFGEKIQWLKVYGNLEKYTNYVDKYKVRNYVEKSIGPNYLIPLLGVYENANDIDYSALPDKFVLKINNGSGYNLIVNDKNKIDIKKTNKLLNKWLKEDYYKIKKEPQYKNVERKIICEKYISDSNGQLMDYKFFCFNGKIEFIEVDFNRFDNHTMNFYDVNWKLLDLKKGNYSNYLGEVNKPKNFLKMIDIVNKLSKQFLFVRVDLYNVDGKIYFGELTFTPAGGVTPFKPLEKDLEYSKLINIDKNMEV